MLCLGRAKGQRVVLELPESQGLVWITVVAWTRGGATIWVTLPNQTLREEFVPWGNKVLLNGIEVWVLKERPVLGDVKVRIHAPSCVSIYREEVWERVVRERILLEVLRELRNVLSDRIAALETRGRRVEKTR